MGVASKRMAGEERQYGSRSYWDTRYTKDNQEQFEWLQSYEHLQPLINEQFTNKAGKVINVGCGRSTLLTDMSRDGYTTVEGVDWCSTLISQCNSQYAGIPTQLHLCSIWKPPTLAIPWTTLSTKAYLTRSCVVPTQHKMPTPISCNARRL